MPFQQAGVLWRSVRAMVANDVMTWTILFMSCLVTFGMAMYISFPVTYYGWSTGNYTIDIVSKFNHPVTSITSMLQLGLLGVEIDMDLVGKDEDTGAYVLSPFFRDGSTEWEMLSFCFFLIFYGLYMMMSVIILLNLLIAMMSTTYAKIIDTSVMQWRLDFARLVLKTELECGWLSKPPCGLFKPWELHAGEKARGQYFFYFRHVDANKEGYGTEGGKAVFDDIEALDDDAQGEATEEAKVPDRSPADGDD